MGADSGKLFEEGFLSMWLIVRSVLFSAGTLATVAAQPGIGSKYGSRDPLVCGSKTEPTRGAPSGQRLVDLVRCGSGGERVYWDQLYLLENVKVEIGKARPYQPTDKANKLDPSKPVYPIRGSFDKYQCN